MYDSPRSYGLDHDNWRPGQLETIQRIQNSTSENVILEAPTGSGKTATATALGRDQRIIALCRTKNLQKENYEGTYGFDSLFGKANYKCAHPKFSGSFADKCAYSDEGMNKCPYAENCEYLIRKSRAIRSDRASLNYAYYLSARWPRDPNNGFDRLVLDEAHQLPDIVLEHAGTDVSESIRRKFNLPSFVQIGSGTSMFMSEGDPVEKAVDWLSDARSSLLEIINANSNNMVSDEERQFARRAESLYNKFLATIEALRLNPHYWYIRSGSTAGKDADGSFVPRFIAKPLTSKYHYNNYFSILPQRLLMSATIGNVADFAAELGISEYQYLSVPNQWPTETRPIIDLKAPKMGRGASEFDVNRQAQIIAKAILDCPPSWSGIIHVTRKSEATYLARRLERYGLNGRMWTPDEKWGTDIQIQEWYRAKQKRSGLIAVSWTWQEGVDLTEERICISAKCFTPDVEIIGPDKTVTMENVAIGDKVFSITDEGQLIVDEVIGIVKKDHVGDIYNINASHCDISVTPDHNMLVDFHRPGSEYGKLFKTEMKNLDGADFCVPTWAKSWIGIPLPESIKLPDKFFPETTMFKNGMFQERPQSNWIPVEFPAIPFVKLCGYYISEGHSFHNKRRKYPTTTAGETWGIAITQNAGDTLDDIESTLKELNLPYRKDKKSHNAYRLVVNSKVLYDIFGEWFGVGAKNKRIPEFILAADVDVLNVLFDALMNGDGHFAKTGQAIYSTSSDELVRNMVELGLKTSARPRVRKARRGNTDIGFALGRKVGTIRPRNITKVPYSGQVWCVTTKSGNVLAGRNGSYIFIGQCPFPYLGDSYEMERMKYSGRTYMWRAATTLEQSLGRTRRGEAEDYDLNGKREQLVAIADGNWTRVKSALSESFLQSIVSV